MTLGEYLERNKIPRATFAKAIGVSGLAVRFWVTGTRMPRRRNMALIARATKGEVTANDFMLPGLPAE